VPYIRGRASDEFSGRGRSTTYDTVTMRSSA
jgi:hypothetical protein